MIQINSIQIQLRHVAGNKLIIIGSEVSDTKLSRNKVCPNNMTRANDVSTSLITLRLNSICCLSHLDQHIMQIMLYCHCAVI